MKNKGYQSPEDRLKVYADKLFNRNNNVEEKDKLIYLHNLKAILRNHYELAEKQIGAILTLLTLSEGFISEDTIKAFKVNTKSQD